MKRPYVYLIIGGSIVILCLAIIFIIIDNESEQVVKEDPISTNVDHEQNDGNEVEEQQTWEPSLQHLSVEFDKLDSTFIAPGFMNDEIIAFEMYLSDEGTGYIGTISRENEAVDFIYETDEGQITNALVGVDDQLFWVEYNAVREDTTPWDIKSYHLTTGEIELVATGIGEDQIDPPVLRVHNDQVTWIEKEIKENVVYSNLIVFEPKNKVRTTIDTVTLDENDERDGKFLLIQRPIRDGVLVEQSVFEPGVEKYFELVLYPYDGLDPVVLLQNDHIIDFTADDNWFVWTENGKVHIVNRETNEEVFTIEDETYEMTFDSPFIVKDTLFYRYSTEQIFSFNLETGDKVEISDSASHPTSIYSKLFNSENYLGFSYMEAIEPENEAQFTIMNLREEGQ